MRAYMVSCPHVRRKVQKWAQKKAPASACNWSHPGPRPTNWLLTICQGFSLIINQTIHAVNVRNRCIACSLGKLKNANRLLTFLTNY